LSVIGAAMAGHFWTRATTPQQPHMPPAASVVAPVLPPEQEPFDWDRAVTESLARLAKKQ